MFAEKWEKIGVKTEQELRKITPRKRWD